MGSRRSRGGTGGERVQELGAVASRQMTPQIGGVPPFREHNPSAQAAHGLVAPHGQPVSVRFQAKVHPNDGLAVGLADQSHGSCRAARRPASDWLHAARDAAHRSEMQSCVRFRTRLKNQTQSPPNS